MTTLTDIVRDACAALYIGAIGSSDIVVGSRCESDYIELGSVGLGSSMHLVMDFQGQSDGFLDVGVPLFNLLETLERIMVLQKSANLLLLTYLLILQVRSNNGISMGKNFASEISH